MMSSTSQVCRGKDLPASEDTGGSCDGHSGMPGFGRQGMQPRKEFMSVDASERRIKYCDCQTLISKRDRHGFSAVLWGKSPPPISLPSLAFPQMCFRASMNLPVSSIKPNPWALSLCCQRSGFSQASYIFPCSEIWSGKNSRITFSPFVQGSWTSREGRHCVLPGLCRVQALQMSPRLMHRSRSSQKN